MECFKDHLVIYDPQILLRKRFFGGGGQRRWAVGEQVAGGALDAVLGVDAGVCGGGGR